MNDVTTRNEITAETVTEESTDSTLVRNARACRAVSDVVRSTLGPNGRSKLLVEKTYDITGDYVVTNDGATILETLPIEDPVAKLVVAAAESQQETYRDGTTTVAVLVGALLENAIELHESGLHSATIRAGYELARERTRTVLDSTAVDVSTEDDYRAILSTAMSGDIEATDRAKLTEIVYRSFQRVGRDDFGASCIKVAAIGGGGIGDSGITDGIVLDKEPVHPDMPSAIRDARVALVDGPIQAAEPDDINLEVSSFEGYQSYFDREDVAVNEALDTILQGGVDALFVSSHLDDRAQAVLADAGVLAVRHVSPDDFRLVGRATGAIPVTDATHITRGVLGFADRVAERRFGTENRLLIEHDATETASVVLRAGTEQVLDELERTVESAVGSLHAVTEDGRAVWGGGATETELGWHLRRYASGVGRREQLAIGAVADAFETVPRALARNAGVDPTDSLIGLRTEHDRGSIDAGITADGDVDGMRSHGVLEPLTTKRSAIDTAFDVAASVLRIDALIATDPLTPAEEDEAAERIEMGEGIDEAIRNVRKSA